MKKEELSLKEEDEEESVVDDNQVSPVTDVAITDGGADGLLKQSKHLLDKRPPRLLTPPPPSTGVSAGGALASQECAAM